MEYSKIKQSSLQGIVFSIILPSYKQADHIVSVIKQYNEGLESIDDSWELIIVVNGPKDGTSEIVCPLTKIYPHLRILETEHAGWGRAVKYGIVHSRGKYICYTNSARTKINDLIKILEYAKKNEDHLVKATRIIRNEIIRKIGSVLYNFEFRLFFQMQIWDVNGTPKVIPRNIINSIDLISDGNLFDAELVARCHKRNIPIIDIPIQSTERAGGKSTTNFVSAIELYWGLLNLRKKI